MSKKILMLALAGALTLGFSNAAFATWRVHLDFSGKTYGIKQGDSVIDMGLTKRQAEKLAKKLNKIQKKDADAPEE